MAYPDLRRATGGLSIALSALGRLRAVVVVSQRPPRSGTNCGPVPTARAAADVGAAWVVLTVAFEFGFGHYVAKQSWDTLLADYNLRRGTVHSGLPHTPLIGFRRERPSHLSLRTPGPPRALAQLPTE